MAMILSPVHSLSNYSNATISMERDCKHTNNN